MALSILILCIVSMTSFNPVASKNTTESTSYSPPLLDFGFSRLIDDLVSANDNSSNHEAMLAIFAEVKNQLKHLSGSSKSISEFISYGMKDKQLNQYLASADHIDEMFELIELYVKDENSDEEELESVAMECTTHGNDLWSSLSNFKYIYYGDRDKNIMSFLIENSNSTTTDACSYVKQSRQYEIYEIYHKLVITTVKVFSTRIYAFNLLGLYSKKADERTTYKSVLTDFNNIAVPAITEASREIISCDGAIKEKGKKFIELKWLFNPISINEVYLNEDTTRCWNTCPDYQNTTFHQYNNIPDINQCSGRLYNCFQETTDVCDPSTNYYKRYSKHPHAKNMAVKKEKNHWCTTKKQRPHIGNGLFDNCDQCICYCDDDDRSDSVRKFSLRAVESDASKNKVITGIQFVEKNQMIYLRIREGELRPNGTIEKSTDQWQSIDEIDWKSPFITEYDYVTITNDIKFVDLDTLVFPSDRIVTGIGLHVQGSHLALKIKCHAFNYSTGILLNSSDYWLLHSPKSRQEITMTAPDSPFFMHRSVVDTRKDTYITFRKTDYEKDAAQTTVPVIDALPVAPDPPIPLSGVGIYYRGKTGYGGVIGLKAITYDFAKVIGN